MTADELKELLGLTDEDLKKPLPKPTKWSQPYWDAAKKHNLRFGVTTHLARTYSWLQTSHWADKEGPKKTAICHCRSHAAVQTDSAM